MSPATDYYTQCEAALLAKLRTLTALFPKSYQVSTDIENLTRGGKYFIVAFPGVFQSSRVTGREKSVDWAIGFDLYVRYSTHSESLGLFKVARSEIFFLLNSDPLLSRTPGVFNVALSAASEVQQETAGDNPNFIIQTFNASVSQRIRFGF